MGYYGNAFHNVDSNDDTNEMTPSVRGAGQRGNLRIPRAELRSILMEKIREVDESPGLQDFEISFLRLIEKLSDGSSYLKLTQLSNSYFLLLLSEKLSDVLTTVF